MKSLIRLTMLCAAIWLMGGCQTHSATKFYQTADLTLPKGCGNGLNENSAVCDCVRVGAAFTKCASGGHVCVQLPGGKSDKDMNIEPFASAAVNNPAYSPCGNPGPCQIGWSRFESWEYYPDKNKLCGRFKNWTADRDIKVMIKVTEK